MIRYPWRIIATSLLAAWAVDFLFWQMNPGISFLIWVSIVLLGALFLMRSEGEKIAWQSYILMGAIFLLGGVVFLRQESFTHGLGILMALVFIWLLASTISNGYWVRFRIFDYIMAGFQTVFEAIARPFLLHLQREKIKADEATQTKRNRSKIYPYLRGLLLAIPILLVLGGLLVSADPIFSGWVENLVHIFKFDLDEEAFFRIFYILILTYIFTGLYSYAVKPRKVIEKPDIDKPLIKGFLGWPETAVIMGCTNLLFAVFLVVQIHYFFGGQVNISETGYTYSEYARRGFGELLAVAILSLLLYLGLSIVAKLEKKSHRTGFTALTFLLIAQVIVILVSAFQRLRLYEEAYGFTQLRIYSHIFMLWLGILLITALALEILSKRGWFALAVLISSFGFVASLAIINVDGQVVRLNVTRSYGEENQLSALDSNTVVDELDSEYFKELSDDAVPVMADFYENSPSAEIRELMGMHLACRQKLLEETSTPWQSFNLSESNARRILSALSEKLSVYQLSKADDQWIVTNGTQEMSCSPEEIYMTD